MDKLKHFLICFLITFLIPFPWGMAIALVMGIGKEIFDEWDYGGFSWGDLAADGAGILLAICARSLIF